MTILWVTNQIHAAAWDRWDAAVAGDTQSRAPGGFAPRPPDPTHAEPLKVESIPTWLESTAQKQRFH